jgi:hypothetical protein
VTETAARTFKLYPEERHWWSMADYGAVLDVVTRLKAKRILEFGPGSSTLALIEGGATHIDTYEDNPDWFGVYQERLEQRFPEIVHIHQYTWSDPLVLPDMSNVKYDLALIDGPLGTLSRPPVIAWCLAHSKAVLVPTEDLKPEDAGLRAPIERLAGEFGYAIEWMETGPLSGGFALLTKAPKGKKAKA